MENKKLISMTDFVLEEEKVLNKYKNHDKAPLFERCVDYANFLKQPLTLGMSVPCDDDGNILEEPNHLDYKSKNSYNELVFTTQALQNKYHSDYDKYQQAQAKVLFKGFEVKKGKAIHLYELFLDDKFMFTYNSSVDTFLIIGSTIENLIKYNLYLAVSSQPVNKCQCKRSTFTRTVDADFNCLCGKCGEKV